MPRYAVFFTLTPAAIAAMSDRPSDRSAAIAEMLEQHGGRLLSYYWMFGQWDGMALAEVPDSASAAAAALAVSSTGAFGHVETHELFDSTQIVSLVEAAGRMRTAFRPPGT